MTRPAIRAQKLGKRYFLRHVQLQQAHRNFQYDTLSDAIVRAASSLFRRKSNSLDEFWPLRDINLEIEPGQSWGIIGHNGAGKSTLLKILSRVTKPSEGTAELRGRLGCLLEVGVGFHQELTGRENVYLNGAVLGMSRREVQRKFDEIVAFAEVERFLDTPVKRYSSGMYVRLAFAVAAHLEPEILIVDEVLAVGDMAFQQKCLAKMRDVAKSGRTILFVSHNMAVVRNLCSHCLLLDHGRIRMQGEAGAVIDEYCRGASAGSGDRVDLTKHSQRRGDKPGVYQWASVKNLQTGGDIVLMGGGVALEVGYEFPVPLTHAPRVGFLIEDGHGQPLLHFSPNFQKPDVVIDLPQAGTFRCEIPWLNLVEGEYFLSLILQYNMSEHDNLNRVAAFRVAPDDVFGFGRSIPRGTAMMYLNSSWSVS